MAIITALKWFLPSRRALRVWFYFTCVFVGLTAVSARALYAQVREGALAFGRELVGLSHLTGDAEALLVNGVRFHHSSRIVEQPLDAVLDALETYCSDHPGLLGQALDQVTRGSAIQEEHRPPRALSRGIVREHAGDGGMVVCFVSDAPHDFAELGPALERFIATSDMSAFGGFIYSYAQQRDDGSTRVATVWTEQGINFRAMFPGSGDAAGADSSVLPRPPRSRRTLSAAAEKKPYGLRVYASSESPDVIESYYAHWMRERGWSRAPHSPDGATTAFLRQDGYQAFVSLSQQEGSTYVTLTEAGRRDGTLIASIQIRE